MDMNEFVDIKCNSCGKVYSFCPMQCKFAPKCECGNDDVGRANRWENYEFGNFTPLKSYKLTLRWVSNERKTNIIQHR